MNVLMKLKELHPEVDDCKDEPEPDIIELDPDIKLRKIPKSIELDDCAEEKETDDMELDPDVRLRKIPTSKGSIKREPVDPERIPFDTTDDLTSIRLQTILVIHLERGKIMLKLQVQDPIKELMLKLMMIPQIIRNILI